MSERAVIRVATEDTFTSLRPDRYASMTDIQIGLQLFETLVGYDRQLRVAGRLAERWACSADGSSYRFALRAGAAFSDGAPITATVVRDFLAGACLDRLGVRARVASIEALGAHEVELRLHQPFAPLLDLLASPAALVTSPAGEGTGAFVRPRMVERSVYVDARGELPVRGAAFVPYRGGIDMWQALRDDRIDVAYECPYEVIAHGVNDPAVVVSSCPSLAVNMLVFNTRSGPLADPAARRAIANAIDKHQLLAEINRGVGDAAQGPIAPTSPFFVPRAPGRRTAGAPPAELTVLATAGFTPSWLALFKDQLARVGTRCVVHALPFPALRRALVHNSFEAALIGYPGFVDPDRVLFEAFHSEGRANHAGLRDPAFDDLIERARRSNAVEQRAELYAEACARLDDLAPAVFLRHGRSIIARRSRVVGIEPHPLGDLDLAKAGWNHDKPTPHDASGPATRSDRM